MAKLLRKGKLAPGWCNAPIWRYSHASTLPMPLQMEIQLSPLDIRDTNYILISPPNMNFGSYEKKEVREKSVQIKRE